MRYALVILALCLSPLAYGQVNGYQRGFLLTHRLDTIKGYIRFQSRVTAPTPCQFRTDKRSAATAYEPGTIHGFCTEDGAYYYSRSIGRTSDVFLEVLVRGYVNLFKFGDIYFVEKGDSVFFELSDELDIVFMEGRRQEQRSRNYSRMLALLMSDCPDASQRASTVPLNDKNLVGLVTLYNSCRGAESSLFRVKGKLKRSRKSSKSTGNPPQR